ncbi:MAG: hypothetical protein HPY69_05310 [Armatimonadetes bacterium]|nr:hypothetical protein [Armatimonadota bacterium]
MQYTLSVPSDSVRSIPDPFTRGSKTYYVLLSVRDVPHDLDMGPDPRIPKPKTPVVKRIQESLRRWDGRFHLLNRGITISARSVDYDPKTAKLVLDIPNDDPRYGIIDGGHTFHSIKSVVVEDSESMPARDEADQRVRLEIMLGVEEHLLDIAQARNYSMSLKTFSLENKKGSFEWLIKALGDKAKLVRFSENDPEPVLVLEILQMLTCVNPTRFSDNDHPVDAYRNAAKCLDWSLEPGDRWGYRKLARVAVDVCELYDYIRYRWPDLYNAPDETGERGKYGKTIEANRRKRGRKSVATYHFIGKEGRYPVEKGLAFPVLAGFRALLIPGPDDSFQWTTDPRLFFDAHGKRLVDTVMTASDNRNGDPHLVGRDESVYAAVYSEVRRWYLEDELKKRR